MIVVTWPFVLAWIACGFFSSKIVMWNMPAILIPAFGWKWKTVMIIFAPLTAIIAIQIMFQIKSRRVIIGDDGIFTSHDRDVADTDESWKKYQHYHMNIHRKTGPAWINTNGHEEYCPFPGSPLTVVIESDGTVLRGVKAATYYVCRNISSREPSPWNRP